MRLPRSASRSLCAWRVGHSGAEAFVSQLLKTRWSAARVLGHCCSPGKAASFLAFGGHQGLRNGVLTCLRCTRLKIEAVSQHPVAISLLFLFHFLSHWSGLERKTGAKGGGLGLPAGAHPTEELLRGFSGSQVGLLLREAGSVRSGTVEGGSGPGGVALAGSCLWALMLLWQVPELAQRAPTPAPRGLAVETAQTRCRLTPGAGDLTGFGVFLLTRFSWVGCRG